MTISSVGPLITSAVTARSVTFHWTDAVVTDVRPGSGSIIDSAGVVWAVTKLGQVTKNGALVPGGGGTSALCMSAGSMWGQDATSKLWWKWNPTTGRWGTSVTVHPPIKITYQVRYRVTGTTAWTLFPGSVSVTSVTITGLLPSTHYDLEVLANGN